MDLEFNVNNQTLKRKDSNQVVTSSSEYLRLVFDFETDDWENVSKYAFFRTGHVNYPFELTEDKVIVPAYFLNDKYLLFGLFGVGDGDIRITTNVLRLHLENSYYDSETVDVRNFLEVEVDRLDGRIDGKVDIIEGKMLSTNDFTDYYKNFLDGFDGNIEAFLEDHKEEIEELLIGEALRSKADKVHKHTESDITDLKDYALASYVDDELDLKVNNTTFNDAVESINTSIGELDTNKTDKTVFNETVNDLENSISDLDTNKTVTITKQATADTGYFSTYVINQGGVALSPKINIPKDYLLKSASLKQCTVKDEPIEGLNVGDWYFDWVLNTADETEESHLYLNANVLTDVYEGDNETIIISDNVVSVKPNVFAFKLHTHTKNDITDFAHNHDERYYTESEIDTKLNEKSNTGHKHTESDITDLQDYALEDDVYSKTEVNNLIYDLNNKMNVNSDKTIIQTEETSNITVQVKENGFPAINKTVNIYVED